MVSFEIFEKAMPPSLLELKVLPSFCFAFKIPDDVAASNMYLVEISIFSLNNVIARFTEILNSLKILIFKVIFSVENWWNVSKKNSVKNIGLEGQFLHENTF